MRYLMQGFMLLMVAMSLMACSDPLEYQITVTKSGEGLVTGGSTIHCGDTCSGTYTQAQWVPFATTLKAHNTSDWDFLGWSSATGDRCGPDPQCTVPLPTRCVEWGPALCSEYEGSSGSAHAVFQPKGTIVSQDWYGLQTMCWVNDTGFLSCWNMANAPSVFDADEVKIGSESAGCVRTGNRFTCWGALADEAPAQLTSVDDFVVTRYFACALGGGEVACWSMDGSLPDLSNPVAIWGDDARVCARDDTGDQCWGVGFDGQTRVPPLNQPSLIDVTGSRSCALDGDGIQCWDRSGLSVSIPLIAQNPRQFGTSAPAFDEPHYCLLDDAGLRCFNAAGGLVELPVALADSSSFELSENGRLCGQDSSGVDCTLLGIASEPVRYEALLNPTAWDYSNDDNGGCTASGNQLQCWRRSGDFWPASEVEGWELSIANPSLMYVDRHSWCVAGTAGLTCQGRSDDKLLIASQPQGLQNITAMDSTDEVRCVIHDGQLSCWGQSEFGVTEVPPLSNPRQVQVGYYHACALDDSGVVCWGEKLESP